MREDLKVIMANAVESGVLFISISLSAVVTPVLASDLCDTSRMQLGACQLFFDNLNMIADWKSLNVCEAFS